MPAVPLRAPPGVVQQDGDWYYREYAGGNGIGALQAGAASAEPAAIARERQKILELFRD